jgi:ParB/Sulfiredoxin domain
MSETLPPLTEQYERRPLASITVPPGRQRREVALDEDFLASVRRWGVLQPIIVRRNGELWIGERRFRASEQLGLADIPVRYVEDLPRSELRMLELEENLRRSELPWRDECLAMGELHGLWKQEAEAAGKEWTYKQSQERLGTGYEVARILRVARELLARNPRLEAASNIRAAYNICTRIDERTAEAVLEDIGYATSEITGWGDCETGEEEVSGVLEETVAVHPPATGAGSFGQALQGEGASAGTEAPRQEARAVRSSPPPAVLQWDFREWARSYSGPRFNFVHCDFPYGKNPFRGEWGGTGDAEFQYEDTDELYWELVETLCVHRERLLAPSAHLMFWLDADIKRQHETIEKFRSLAPDLIFQPRALVWLKSDNVGIAPDPQRGPRWVTEIALMASRGDRKVLQPLANGYPAPTARHLHPSAKPEPMLRHFMRMFVDSTTRMLDPTCGGGSSLRAAESLGACAVLGLERDEQYASAALKALKEFRSLRELAR